jgi:hypothetical protein
MYSKRKFYALEVMCRERAGAAKKDMDYWLAEAEEWTRVRRSCNGSERLTSSPELTSSGNCRTTWIQKFFPIRRRACRCRKGR